MEKVDEIDFNGKPVAPESGQPEKTGDVEEPAVVEETPAEPVKEEVESIDALPQWAQEKLKKTESEREIFKQGMLKYKSLTLEPETKEEPKEEEYPDWDETSKKFQEQTEKKAAKIAEQQARNIIMKNNENEAIKKFISAHPEAEKDWGEIASNFHKKDDDISVDAYLKGLDRAYFTTRYDRGEISNLESAAFKKGEKKGKGEAQIADLSSVSKTTPKSLGKETPAVSEGAMRLAEKMRVPTDKLALEDDSLSAEIKL